MSTALPRHPPIRGKAAPRPRLDPRDVQYLSHHQQPLQPPAETVHGFSPTVCSQRHEGSPPHTLRQSPMNTSTQALVPPLLAPYATAATILVTATRYTWQALRCDRTLDIYRTLSILLQVAGWLAFLVCLYTLQAGRATRRFYEAEWAVEANALALRIDRALPPSMAALPCPRPMHCPKSPPATLRPIASLLPSTMRWRSLSTGESPSIPLTPSTLTRCRPS
ncbi:MULTISPECIES: hypothetical protein [Cyanophyceae]|uniref:hypothetical protein n=1 Tax=Cyanophyceae TaxID=3028117 RepID=UPI0016842992|nr:MULTISPECIES: hypothetical protein [Cyanophyceae]MBD1919499.1 hypothetical protein [Phormidium sp. FACHB-77]MBD2054436.1 hypothetical protein [Leptolyngbya sp. FACHB-60]